MAATRACNLIMKENNLDPSVGNVDIPTIFGGTWCLRGWTANRAVVTAIAEKTAQVIDASYRCKTCVQCSSIEDELNTILNVSKIITEVLSNILLYSVVIFSVPSYNFFLNCFLY